MKQKSKGSVPKFWRSERPKIHSPLRQNLSHLTNCRRSTLENDLTRIAIGTLTPMGTNQTVITMATLLNRPQLRCIPLKTERPTHLWLSYRRSPSQKREAEIGKAKAKPVNPNGRSRKHMISMHPVWDYLREPQGLNQRITPKRM